MSAATAIDDPLRADSSLSLLSQPQRVSLAERYWLFTIWLFVTVCNICKPFHVDDTAHLEIARWILGHPFHPMSGILNWNGVEEPIAATNQPHLFFYMMAGWGHLFGFSELAMHTLQALFALLSILLFFRLVRFLIPAHRLWLTAMFSLSPAFVVNQNMMVDIPLLTFWLAFFNCVLTGINKRRQTLRYVIAALACAGALLIKYSSLVLLPVLLVSLVMERRWRQLWTALIPVTVLLAWSAFNIWDYGSAHIAARAAGSTDHLRPIKFIIAWLIIAGAVTPLGIIAGLSYRCLIQSALGITLTLSISFILLWFGVATTLISDKTSDTILLVAFILNGAVLVVALLPSLQGVTARLDNALHYRNIDNTAPLVILMLWLVGTTAFYVLFPPFSATRHVLLALPPVFLLFGGLYADKLTQVLRVFGLASTISLTLGLGIGDFAFASFYRDAALEVGDKLVRSPRPWTSGHWGWQWYSSAVGLRQVDYRRTRFRRGDIFVEAADIDHQYPTSRLTLQPIGRIDQRVSLANVFCTARPSRFYLSSSRFGPWSLSRNCLGHIIIYRVLKNYP